MSKRHWLWLLIAAIALAGGSFLGWRSVGRVNVQPAPVQHDPLGKSADLQGDIKLMWETQPLQGTHDPSLGPNPGRLLTKRSMRPPVFSTPCSW